MPLILALAASLGAFHATENPTPLWIEVTAFAVVFALTFLYAPFVLRRGFGKRFKKEQQNLTNVRVTLDDAGFHSNVPGVGRGITEWAGMEGWSEGKSVIVLRRGLLMSIFPKVDLDEAQLYEVRELLTDKLGPVGVMRKREPSSPN